MLSIGVQLQGAPEVQHPSLVPLAVIYFLSGGNTTCAEKIANAKGVSTQDKELLLASALFMRGDHKSAASLLAGINPLELSGRLTGRVALAQAFLLGDKARQERLDVAIASMPGTLVEESALRRSALAYAEMRREPEFWKRLARYAHRFPNSVYAKSFWYEAMSQIVGWKESKPDFNPEELDIALSMLPLAMRRSIYLELTRAAASTGQSELTGLAARRFKRLAIEGSNEERLSRFFIAIFDIVLTNSEEALRILQNTPRDILNPQEQALLDAALAVGGEIERPTSAPPYTTTDLGDKSVLESRAHELLAKSHELIQESN